MEKIRISKHEDVTESVRKTVKMADSIGFKASTCYLVATAVSELARNIMVHAEVGWIVLRECNSGSNVGIEISAKDHGPGIKDIGLALTDHYSTRGSLGLGLPGAKRIMDEFDIRSDPGKRNLY